MNPLLMVISGPLLVGYFNLGRLIVMPLNVMMVGLINSSTPTLRRVFQKDGAEHLTSVIKDLARKNMIFTGVYVSLLAGAHLTGLMQRFVPDYNQVKWFLLLWIVTITVSIYRFWFGQYFIVSMQFKFLMRVSVVASVLTLAGMLIFGVLLAVLPLALLSAVVGEFVTIALYERERRRVR